PPCPPQMQRARVSVPDRLLAGGRFVDRIQRQGDFDELLLKAIHDRPCARRADRWRGTHEVSDPRSTRIGGCPGIRTALPRDSPTPVHATPETCESCPRSRRRAPVVHAPGTVPSASSDEPFRPTCCALPKGIVRLETFLVRSRRFGGTGPLPPSRTPGCERIAR